MLLFIAFACIMLRYISRRKYDCYTCRDSGTVVSDGKLILCPTCKGKGKTITL